MILTANKLRTALLFAGKLLVSSVPVLPALLQAGCSISPAVITQQAPAEEFQAEPHYVTPEDYERIIKAQKVDFLRDELVIMELTQPVKYLSALRGSDTVSFTTVTMPKDLQMLLQKYKMTGGEDFYRYVIEHTDRFIFSPDLKLYSYSVSGASMTRGSLRGVYPKENTTFVNMWYAERQDLFSDWYIASVMVHEAAHHVLITLILENKVSNEYRRWNLGERYTDIIELEILYALLRDPLFADKRCDIANAIYQLEREIKEYNAELGLEEGDRTLLPR